MRDAAYGHTKPYLKLQLLGGAIGVLIILVIVLVALIKRAL